MFIFSSPSGFLPGFPGPNSFLNGRTPAHLPFCSPPHLWNRSLRQMAQAQRPIGSPSGLLRCEKQKERHVPMLQGYRRLDVYTRKEWMLPALFRGEEPSRRVNLAGCYHRKHTQVGPSLKKAKRQCRRLEKNQNEISIIL